MTGSSERAHSRVPNQAAPAGLDAEPWLRATLTAVPPVPRAVMHALELASEDVARWCGGLTQEEFFCRPYGLPPVAYQLRHIGGSLDRFFTYAEGAALSEQQLAALARELDAPGDKDAVLQDFHASLQLAAKRLRASVGRDLSDAVRIGRKELPSTLGGLLVHAAEHTQRHVGQAITTAKLLLAKRSSSRGN